MSYFTDGNRTLDISLIGENNVGWEMDFYDAGQFVDLYGSYGYESSASLTVVDDVDYLVGQAKDLIAGEGDFAEQGPDESDLTVRELDPDDEDDAAILSYVEDKLGYAYWVSPTGDRVRVMSSPTGHLVAVEALSKDGRARWSLRSWAFDSTEELVQTVWRRLIAVGN